MDPATYEAAIRQRAYAIWEEEGRPHGREWDHWRRAAQEILSLAPVALDVPPVAKPRKTTKGRIRAALRSAISA
jgi:hypothetical protein